ncbi:MAG TPA: alpha/beta fold hydrolase [Gemmatimonadaceae bacterium]|jgi:dipeptidyl aminopeptidase/acylaminoacyl peptidase|nr:alpha/beta fold hydrolase [Gemmatimonadaceae bacterium]
MKTVSTRWALALAIATAAPAALTAQNGKLPPLIDRELFFGNPEISGAQISPDGKYISFLKPYKDTRNVWVKRADAPWSSAKLITNDTKRPVTQYFWSRDGKYILFAQDQGGDENFNVYAVDPNAAPAAGSDVPPARNLTAAKGVRAVIYDVPRNDPNTMYVGINDRDKAWHDLYKVNVATGDKTLVRQNTERIAGWVFDNASALRLAVRTTDKGDTEILRVDPSGFTQIYSCTVFETCAPIRFDKTNSKVYMQTNKGAPDLTRLVLFDPATKAEQLVESDPLNRVDFGAANFSDVTNELVGTAYVDDRTRAYWKDPAWEKDYNFLKSKLPGKEIAIPSTTRDERVWMIVANSDREPGERWLFDRDSKKLTFLYRVFDKLPRESLAQQKPISYPSTDGLTIPAYLTLPVGVEAKNLPLVVYVHGGPWGRDNWGYSSIPQFLANRGYAVLQPNFRASTGYGKKFLNAGNNEWGQKMQDDISTGVKYLIAQGIADPKRVGIMGGSYGGYATLAGLAFTPDLYAAGVSIVGPSNLLTLLNSIPPYWESIRTIFNERMGNPNTAEGKAQLVRQSPLNSATKIKAPLLVIQGANDPRVNRAESEQIVVALRDRGFPVEYLLAPDEGHGFARPINNLVLFTSAEKFLAKHLGGRYQEGMTPAITQRMAVLTVDPKTVVLAKKMDAPSGTAPKPAVDLAPGTATYKGSLAAGGQSMAMDLTRTVKDSSGAWLVTETAVLPMGTMSDEATLDKGTLLLRKRVIHQGPAVVQVSFADNKATGTMSMNGQDRPITADIGGSLFADGAGASDVIGTLPIADGYTTTFRNFDIMSQKVNPRQLKVVGSEKVTVPAGTFDAWKIEITPADGGTGESTTLWVDKASRRAVKSVTVIPQMNGAVATAELVK